MNKNWPLPLGSTHRAGQSFGAPAGPSNNATPCLAASKRGCVNCCVHDHREPSYLVLYVFTPRAPGALDVGPRCPGFKNRYSRSRVAEKLPAIAGGCRPGAPHAPGTTGCRRQCTPVCTSAHRNKRFEEISPQQAVVVQVHGMRQAVQDAAGGLAPVGAALVVVDARLSVRDGNVYKQDECRHPLHLTTQVGSSTGDMLKTEAVSVQVRWNSSAVSVAVDARLLPSVPLRLALRAPRDGRRRRRSVRHPLPVARAGK